MKRLLCVLLTLILFAWNANSQVKGKYSSYGSSNSSVESKYPSYGSSSSRTNNKNSGYGSSNSPIESKYPSYGSSSPRTNRKNSGYGSSNSPIESKYPSYGSSNSPAKKSSQINQSSYQSNWTTPIENATTPVENAFKPIENATKPIEDWTTPIENATTPVENAFKPIENATKPIENWTAPIENATTPVENAFKPIENATKPIENWTAPIENATTPIENAFKPIENATKPIENWTAPIENATTPVENAFKPMENATKPIENWTAPIENGTAPIENAFRSVENATKPIQNWTAPIENGTAPVEVTQKSNGLWTKPGEFTIGSEIQNAASDNFDFNTSYRSTKNIVLSSISPANNFSLVDFNSFKNSVSDINYFIIKNIPIINDNLDDLIETSSFFASGRFVGTGIVKDANEWYYQQYVRSVINGDPNSLYLVGYKISSHWKPDTYLKTIGAVLIAKDILGLSKNAIGGISKPLIIDKAAKGVVQAEKVSGSYLLEFQSGKFYAGKGFEPRMMQSINRIETTYGDKLLNSTFYPASSTRAAFINEHNLMMQFGGPKSFNPLSPTYNKIFSPGRKLGEF